MKIGLDVRVATILAAAISTGVLAMPAAARDKPKPPPPCPLNAVLRVADAASIAGLQSLSRCGSSIIAAPASPVDHDSPADLRIAPESRSPIHRASTSVAVADRNPTTGGSAVRVVHIVPAKDEPVELAAPAAGLNLAGAIDPEAILTLRPVSYSTPYDPMITRVAARHRVDPLLLHAVIHQESRYRATATSPVGARGLMQLMPGTARMLGVTAITDAESNVDGGARLLRRLHQRYGDFELTLAAYNAGEGAVQKYGNRVPPYRETQNYVRSVMTNYSALVAEQGSAGR